MANVAQSANSAAMAINPKRKVARMLLTRAQIRDAIDKGFFIDPLKKLPVKKRKK